MSRSRRPRARRLGWIRARPGAPLLAEFGLEGSADRLAGELDYGAQRAWRSRAPWRCAALPAARRPAAGMNPTRSNQLLAELAELRDGAPGSRCSSSITTCPSSCVSRSHRVLNRGQVIAQGKPAEFNDPAVIEAYIGRKRAARARLPHPSDARSNAMTRLILPSLAALICLSHAAAARTMSSRSARRSPRPAGTPHARR